MKKTILKIILGLIFAFSFSQAYSQFPIYGDLRVYGLTQLDSIIKVQNGAVGNPAYTFTNDLNVGFYLVGADSLGISIGGVLHGLWDVNGLLLSAGKRLSAPTITDGTFSVGSGAFTGIASITDGTATWSGSNLSGFADITATSDITATDSISGGWLRAGSGTVGIPAFAFTTDGNSGFYRIGENNIGLGLGGVKEFDFLTTGLTVTDSLKAAFVQSGSGTVSNPAYSFTADGNSGMYRIGENSIGFSTAGVLSATIEADKDWLFAGKLGVGITPTANLHIIGASILGGNSTIGIGGAGVDYTLAFDGETNDGTLTWMEDEAEFRFNNNLSIAATKKLWLDGGGNTYLTESSADVIDVYANALRSFRIAATGSTIGGATASVDYSLTFDGETNDGVLTWMEDEDGFNFADNVGIKQTNPFYALDVNGNIRIPNNTWIIADDAIGNPVNLISLNNQNVVEFGANVAIGAFYTASDAGQTVIYNQSIINSIHGTVHSFDFQLDDVSVLKGKTTSDGGGGRVANSTYVVAKDLYVTDEHTNQATVTGDTEFTSVVPGKFLLKYLIAQETAGNAATLDLGTTAGASDVFLNQVFAASTITTVVINKVFSFSAAQSLWLNDDDVSSSWNSGSLNVYFVIERISE